MIPMSDASAEAFEAAIAEGGHALSLNESLCINVLLGGTVAPDNTTCNMIKCVAALKLFRY